ncbi:hypothetical protein DXG01_010684, partial [Tephrocybe rancida]
MDILGSFEQVDLRGRAAALIDEVLSLFENGLRSNAGSKVDHGRVHTLRKAREASTSQHALLQLASETLADLSNSEDASALLGKVNTLLATSDAVGRFEWVDGPLVRAMKSGHWLLMDGANLCNPSVLDRLNSLCEHDGVLTLSERGYVDGRVEVLRPHPNFRLFMTVDPQFGELSRAMRNRGVEIALISSPIADDARILCDHQRLPPFSSIVEVTKTWSLTFEAARRGLSNSGAVQVTSLTTSGRSFDQDSGLSGLVDHGPMMSMSTLTEFTDAHLFFVARTTSPAHAPLLDRWLIMLQDSRKEPVGRLQALLSTFGHRTLTEVLVRLREAYSLSLALPSDLVLTQPMDFYLNAPPCHDKNLLSDVPTAHLLVLETLNLAVTLFLCAEDRTSTSAVAKPVEKSEKKNQALRDMSALLNAIHVVSRSTLDTLATDNEETQT